MCNTRVKFILKPNNPSNALNATGGYDEKRMVSSTPSPIRLQTHSKVEVKAAKAASPSEQSVPRG